jgi:hypothetical protein
VLCYVVSSPHLNKKMRMADLSQAHLSALLIADESLALTRIVQVRLQDIVVLEEFLGPEEAGNLGLRGLQ